jgi:hypothetical protein
MNVNIILGTVGTPGTVFFFLSKKLKIIRKKRGKKKATFQYKNNFCIQKKHPKVVGIPKTEFQGLLKALMETANPGQHLPAAFNKCGLIYINPARVMERIPSRSMAAMPGTTRELLNSTFNERLEELRGVD